MKLEFWRGYQKPSSTSLRGPLLSPPRGGRSVFFAYQALERIDAMFARSLRPTFGPTARVLCLLALARLLSGLAAVAEEPRATPLPVPLTRPEMKQALEDLKGRPPRIPLPDLTEEEKTKLGDRISYESRLRYH